MDCADDHSGTQGGNCIRAPPETQNQYYPVLPINLPDIYVCMCVLDIYVYMTCVYTRMYI